MAPFINLFYKGWNRKVKPCCEGGPELEFEIEPDAEWSEVWQHPHFQELRAAMLNGQTHGYCANCLKKEGMGIANARAMYGSKATQGLKDLILSKEHGNQHQAPLMIDYRANNLCNLKCRMCHPVNSTLFAREALDTGLENQFDFPSAAKLKALSVESGTDEFIKKIPKTHLESIKLLGGEPTIQRDVHRFVDELAARPKAEEQVLTLTTNGARVDENFYAKLGAFKKVKVNLSLDGTGSYYEYIRTPSKWSLASGNIEKILAALSKARHSELSVNCVVQMYNAFGMADTLLFFIQLMRNSRPSQRVSVFLNPVDQKWLSTALLTDRHREAILEDLSRLKENECRTPEERHLVDRAAVIFKDVFEIKPHWRSQFEEYTRALDVPRRTSLVTLDARYAEYLPVNLKRAEA